MRRSTTAPACTALLLGGFLLAACSESEPAATGKAPDPGSRPGAEDRFRLALKEAPERVVPLFEARTFAGARGDTMPYRLLAPLRLEEGRTYPLVVCLAGHGSRGSDNVAQVAGSWPAQVLAEPANRENYPAFVLVPQCPARRNWGSSVHESVRARWQRQSTVPWPAGVDSVVYELIDALGAELPIDADRLYVTGQSMGGYGAWHFIISRPRLFAAAVPISGGADPALAESIAHVPVWAFHGDQDPAVPVAYSRDIIAALREAGSSPRYTEFPGEGHVVWPLAFDDPGLLDWLFAQRRSPGAGVE